MQWTGALRTQWVNLPSQMNMYCNKEADHSGDFLFKNSRKSQFWAMSGFTKMYLLV